MARRRLQGTVSRVPRGYGSYLARVGGVAGAAYQGAQGGLNAYKKIDKYLPRGNKRSSSFQRKLGPMNSRPAYKKARTAYNRPPTSVGHGLRRRRNKKTLKKPISTRKLALAAYRRYTRSYQGLSNFDLDSGQYFIGNSNKMDGSIVTPIHVINLTNLRNNPDDVVTDMNVHYKLRWAGEASSSAIQAEAFSGQDLSATGSGDPTWVTIMGPQSNVDVTHAYLVGTSIGFNFYGARTRATRFQVHLVSYKDDDYNPLIKGGEEEVKTWLTGLERPLVYNNLTPRVPGWKKGIKFLKTWSYNLEATTNDVLNTSVGSIMEAKIYIKHNTMLNFKNDEYDKTGRADHSNFADYTVDFEGVRNSPTPKQRLHLIVTAFAPERVPDEEFTATETPSYDMIIRQSWMIPTGLSTIQ